MFKRGLGDERILDPNFFGTMDQQAINANSAIDQALKQGFEERTTFVKQALNRLPNAYQKVFCKNAQAYSILGDCP